jgi:murein DD-endopeptidase MepM/ murein hydrolase activator NlpD
MNSVSVHAGQSVRAGQVIGTLGKTGSASGTEPHLHFSIYPNDNYEGGVNPYSYAVRVDPRCRSAAR